MARFDRQKNEASSIPASLDAATGELESFVEKHVREIIDAAVERAAQVEREAAERARQVELAAERKSQEMLDEAYTRAWRILDGIDLLENGVGDMIGALRLEMEGFAADLGSASPDGHPRAHDNGAGSIHDEAATAGAPRSTERLAGGEGSHAEVEQMIIEQVAILFREGRSRADAERFVMRFKQGEDYLHVLDRIYRGNGEDAAAPEPSSSRPPRIRRGFRARRG